MLFTLHGFQARRGYTVLLVFGKTGRGGKSLADLKIGDTDFRTNKWLGYKETPFEAIFHYRKPKTLHMLSFSTLIDVGSYIMPAAELQVWGATDGKNWKL